jgi:cell wall-associated NlpC family hydrolase
MPRVELDFDADSDDAQISIELLSDTLKRLEAVAKIVRQALENVTIPAGAGAKSQVEGRIIENALEGVRNKAVQAAFALGAVELVQRRIAGRFSTGHDWIFGPPALGAGPTISGAAPDPSYVRGVPGSFAQPSFLGPPALGAGPTISGAAPDPSYVRGVPGSFAQPSFPQLMPGPRIAGPPPSYVRAVEAQYAEVVRRTVASLGGDDVGTYGGGVRSTFPFVDSDQYGDTFDSGGSGGGRRFGGYGGRRGGNPFFPFDRGRPGPDQLLRGILPGGQRAGTGALALGGTLGASLIGPLGSAAAPLLPAAGVLGGLGVANIAVLATAFSGLSDAISGDAEALEKLDPIARKFVDTLRSYGPELSKVQDAAREGLFPGLTKGINEGMTVENLELLRTGARTLGEALGDVATQWGQAFGSNAFTNTVKRDLPVFGDLTREAGDSLLHFATGLGVILQEALPYTEWLSGQINLGGQWFETWAKNEALTGKLAERFEHGKEEIALVADVLEELLGFVYELAVALEPLGNELLVSVAAGLESMAEWVKENRDDIEDITTGALRGFIDVLQIILEILGPMYEAAIKVADAVGGWETVFAVVIGLNVVSILAGWATAFYGVATAIGVAEGSAAALQRVLVPLGVALGAFAAGNWVGGKIFGGDGDGPFGQPLSQPVIRQGKSGKGTFESDVYVSLPDGRAFKFSGGRWYALGADGDAPISRAAAAKALGVTQKELDKATFGPRTASQIPNTLGALLVGKDYGGGAGDQGDKTGDAAAAQISGAIGFAASHVAAGTPYSWGGGHNASHKPSMGTPHSYGGGAARVGYDCSGLISAAYAKVGIDIPGTSQAMMNAGVGVGLDEIQAGDIVITNGGGHAVLYIGGGQVIAASSSAGKVVKQPLSDHINSIVSIRRIVRGKPATQSEIDQVVKAAMGDTGQGTSTAGLTVPPPNAVTPKAAETEFLPLNLQAAIAAAGTTPKRLGDDVKALRAAVRYLEGARGKYKGEELVNLLQELGQLKGKLQDTQDAMKPELYPIDLGDAVEGLKGLKPVIRGSAQLLDRSDLLSARSLAGSLLGGFGITTAASAGTDTGRAKKAALDDLDDLKRRLTPKIKEVQKELAGVMMSPERLAELRERMATWKGLIGDAVSDAQQAVQAHQQRFADVWGKMASAAMSAFNAETAKWKPPSQILLDQLNADREKQSLKQALEDAHKQMADALVSTDASGALDAIRQTISKFVLANAVDAVQSDILGGIHEDISGSALLKQLQEDLGKPYVNLEAVKAAQKAIDDAEFSIRAADLRDKAELEQQAHDEMRERQLRALEAMARDWVDYYNRVGGNIAAIKALWVDALSVLDPAAAGVLSSTTDAQGDPKAPASVAKTIENAVAGAAAATAATKAAQLANIERGLKIPGTNLSSSPNVTLVQIDGNGISLEELITVKVNGQTQQISRSLGEQSNLRVREGAY